MKKLWLLIKHGRGFMTVLKQDQEIKKLRKLIEAKDQFIIDVINEFKKNRE